jgi:predicted regulator of Ras-like GTPase activity (Roadblock/LC7/MglB family)
MHATRLPTIRELVATLAKRDGVEAVLLLGRDGMVIDGHCLPGLDLDQLAAHVPPLVTSADELSATAIRGGLVTAVLEYERGYAVVTTSEACSSARAPARQPRRPDRGPPSAAPTSLPSSDGPPRRASAGDPAPGGGKA